MILSLKYLQILRKAIDLAYNNIYKFHSSQLQKKNIIEVQKGINCWQEKKSY